jgi:hypothetical protein
MAWEKRLPSDWRAAVAVAVGTVLALSGLHSWMVGVAQAAVAPTKDAVSTIGPKVNALYLACVARGECKPPEVLP